MSIAIAVVNQQLDGGPVCAMTVDSCQTRMRDPLDPSKNQYHYDVNKIHVFGMFLIAECGNPYGFSQYWRLAEQWKIAGGGIEHFMDRSREIMQAVGREWQGRYARQWPHLAPEQVRQLSRSLAVIAGWSRGQGRILVRAISDDPDQFAEVTESGFLVSGGSRPTRLGTNDYLRGLLAGAQEDTGPGWLQSLRTLVTGQGAMFDTLDGILRASRMAAQRAGRLEFQHTRARTIAGRIHQMVIRGPAAPEIVTGPPAVI